jgi:hypothetical protein
MVGTCGLHDAGKDDANMSVYRRLRMTLQRRLLFPILFLDAILVECDHFIAAPGFHFEHPYPLLG